jgi:hypothetical protein
MPINWRDFSPNTKRTKLHGELRKFITEKSYKEGNWTLSEILNDNDERKHVVYKILEGIQPDGRSRPDLRPMIVFRFEVLTRQACCRDKNGRTIWETKDAFELYGEDGDHLPAYDDKPKPGDIVEWKGHRIEADPETGNPVDSRLLKKWALMGKRPNEYDEYEVDQDGCILVSYPQCKAMLDKRGFGGPKPRFRKGHIQDKKKRRMTNWWFKEVPPGQKMKRKKRADAGKPRGPNPEPAKASATE